MQIKVISLSIHASQEEHEALNRFLRSHKILSIEQNLVSSSDGVSSYWSFCIRYLDHAGSSTKTSISARRKEKIDYKSKLGDAAFAIFTKLRDSRRLIAKEEAIPAFAVFTDAELAEIAQLPEITLSSLQSIRGIGEKKAKKYVLPMIAFLSSDEQNTEL